MGSKPKETNGMGLVGPALMDALDIVCNFTVTVLSLIRRPYAFVITKLTSISALVVRLNWLGKKRIEWSLVGVLARTYEHLKNMHL